MTTPTPDEKDVVIARLWQALVAARYEINGWLDGRFMSRKNRRRLEASLAKYDAVIEATFPPQHKGSRE